MTADNSPTQYDLLQALNQVQAIVQFDLQGQILDANENFLRIFGYTAEHILGQHHKMFCAKEESSSPDYQAFWDKLAHGEHSAGIYHRIDAQGKDVWIQASYNPVLDSSGKAYKVIKFATDITFTSSN